MRLPQLQTNDEVRVAVPCSGHIGIDSPNASERIGRFSPDYACEEGNVVLVVDPPQVA